MTILKFKNYQATLDLILAAKGKNVESDLTMERKG